MLQSMGSQRAGHDRVTELKSEEGCHSSSFGLEIVLCVGTGETQRQDMDIVPAITGGARSLGDSAVSLAEGHWACTLSRERGMPRLELQRERRKGRACHAPGAAHDNTKHLTQIKTQMLIFGS